MPVTTYLNIEAAAGHARRKVLLIGGVVRIGRHPVCDVRLDNPAIEDLSCVLRRRPDGWLVEPASVASEVWIAGRRVEAPTLVAAGSPIVLGPFNLKLDESRVEPVARDWALNEVRREPRRPEQTSRDAAVRREDAPLAPALSAPLAPALGEHTGRAAASMPQCIGIEPSRLRKWQSTIDRCERWLKARRDDRRVNEALRSAYPNREPRMVREPQRECETRRDEGLARPDPGSGPGGQEKPADHWAGKGSQPLGLGIARPAQPGEDDRSADHTRGIARQAPRLGLPNLGYPPLLDDDDLKGREAWERSDRPASDYESPAQDAVVPEIAHDIESLLNPPSEERGERKPLESPRGDTLGSHQENPGRDGSGAAAPTQVRKGAAAPRSSETPDHGRGEESNDFRRGAHGTSRPGLPSIQMILQERHGQTALSPASDKMAHAVAIVSPTKPQAPRSWSIRSPWPRVFLLLISLVSCAGSLFVGWHWSQDNRIAAALTDTLLSGTRDPSAFDSLEPLPSFSWWSSTTDHLYLRGVALAQRREDIASQDESEWLLDLAENAGPFHGGVRHARMEAARVEGDADRTATPPSEVATLVSAARKAAQEGHHETAAEHARSALAIVARSDPILAPAPRYDASSAVRRAHLPQEDQYLTILEGLPDMNAGGTQRLQEWLPRSPVAWLATIRLLRERSRDSAEGLAAQMPAMIEEGGDADRRALARAACAEAEALLGRWEHARQGYQDALGLTSLRRLRAIFWLNLADVSLRLDDIGAARSAREEARENALGDEKMSNVVSAAQADRFTQNEMASRPPASRRP